jgi:hypothetical protein
MAVPAADCASISSASAPSPVPSGPGRLNINPVTGLSTDYLNHFTEVIMVLEMAGTMPECLDDLRGWRPKTYCEHFAASGFSNRDTVVLAYEAADPAVREALDRTSETLNDVILEARDVVLRHLATPEGEELTRCALTWIRPLIARTAAVINGVRVGAADPQSPQAAIDAMFDR